MATPVILDGRAGHFRWPRRSFSMAGSCDGRAGSCDCHTSVSLWSTVHMYMLQGVNWPAVTVFHWHLGELRLLFNLILIDGDKETGIIYLQPRGISLRHTCIWISTVWILALFLVLLYSMSFKGVGYRVYYISTDCNSVSGPTWCY